MDAALFTKMLSDKNILDLRKLGYKFPQADIKEFTKLLKNGQVYRSGSREILGRQSLKDVYRVNAQVTNVQSQNIVLVDRDFGGSFNHEELR